MEEYFRVDDLSQDACEAKAKWRTRALKTYICPGCLTLRKEMPLPVVKLRYAKPLTAGVGFDCSGMTEEVSRLSAQKKATINFIRGTGIGIVSQAFLAVLGKKVVKEGLELEHLIGPDKEVIENFFAFRGNYQLLVRGNKKSESRKCKKCGRLLYHAMGQPYILASQIGSSPIYESRLSLIVNDEICTKLKAAQLPYIGFTRVLVRETPIDGLQ